MSNDDLSIQERIDRDRLARQLGHNSFADAPAMVQRNIANRAIEMEEPLQVLRPGGDD